MTYKTKDYSYLIGIEGFSETMLKNHFSLYEGYVKNTNKLVELLGEKPKDGKDPGYAELKRHLGWEWNGMRLHEYYFENLICPTPKPEAVTGTLALAFGSYEAWEQDFKATGGMRGIGWVILYKDNASGALYNQWVNEHDAGHLAGGSPILVMDIFEHAYMTDYGLDRAGYIAAFFKNLNWDIVAKRLK